MGFLLMKQSALLEDNRPWYRRWRWFAGFLCLLVLQTGCDAVSLTLLPLSVVAPFAGLTIVFSLLLASSGACGRAESLSTSDMVGAGVTIVGVCGVSAFAPHSGAESTLAEASESLTELSFAVPTAVLVMAVAGCLGASVAGKALPAIFFASGAATCAALSQLSMKLVSLAVKEVLSGLPVPPTGLVGVGALCLSAPTQLALLNAALTAERASVAVPLYQGSTVSLTTLVGGIAFHEFAGVTLLGGLAYAVFVAIATCGLVTLARSGHGDESADMLVHVDSASDLIDEIERDAAATSPVGDLEAFAPPLAVSSLTTVQLRLLIETRLPSVAKLLGVDENTERSVLVHLAADHGLQSVSRDEVDELSPRRLSNRASPQRLSPRKRMSLDSPLRAACEAARTFPGAHPADPEASASSFESPTYTTRRPLLIATPEDSVPSPHVGVERSASGPERMGFNRDASEALVSAGALFRRRSSVNRMPSSAVGMAMLGLADVFSGSVPESSASMRQRSQSALATETSSYRPPLLASGTQRPRASSMAHGGPSQGDDPRTTDGTCCVRTLGFPRGGSSHS